MSRKGKGPRLNWRQDRSVWEIRDTGITPVSTGTSCREDAETALAFYIERKHRPSGPVALDGISISTVLTIYAEEHAQFVADPARIGYAIDALDTFWGEHPASYVTGATCRRYGKTRFKKNGEKIQPGTLRRELNVLQAAFNHCHKEGYLLSAPQVSLPAKADDEKRWLTREEAYWLLRGARALSKKGRHLQHFILHGLYTGSRKATILATRINLASTSGGHVDTVNGILYRKPMGKVETKKRQSNARIPPRYLAQLRRMDANGRMFVVQDYQGNRVGDIRKAFDHAKELAEQLAKAQHVELDLSEVVPHTLKHTAITWALQNGASIWDAAGYFSTSVETIQKVYGHHSPDFQNSAVEAMNRPVKARNPNHN